METITVFLSHFGNLHMPPADARALMRRSSMTCEDGTLRVAIPVSKNLRVYRFVTKHQSDLLRKKYAK